MMKTISHQHCINTPQGRIFAQSWAPTRETKGSPLVLLHDSLGCVALWRDFPERLADAVGRKVIAYDRLGFGRSDPHPGKLTGSFVLDEPSGDFKSVCEQLDVEHVVVMGHSVGGSMAVACAASHPGACEGLIAVSAQAYVDDDIRTGIRAAKRQFGQPGELEKLKKYHGDKAQWVLNAWVDTWLSESFNSWSLSAVLPKVKCPALVLHGDLDEYGSVRHAGRIAEDVSGPVSLRILKNCGHVPYRVLPVETLAEMASFLGQQVQA